MGILGLTTYISKNPNLFESYELCNTPVIIDANSLCSSLFVSCFCRDVAYGGDYDYFAHIIKETFEKFSKVGIIPILVCDGGFEDKKLEKLIERKSQKVERLEKTTPFNVDKNCFPLLMRETFKLIVKSLNVTTLQSDFEADGEIAALAKMLNAPVMSTDSDFYIFDVLYLPLTSFCLKNLEVTNVGNKQFIKCQVFKVEAFLKHLSNSSDKSVLPLLAVLLGNDYMERSTFKTFYNKIKQPSNRRHNPNADLLDIFRWLKKNSVEDTYEDVLNSLPPNARDEIGKRMKEIMMHFLKPKSTLYKYLPSTCKKALTTCSNESTKIPIFLKQEEKEKLDQKTILEPPSGTSQLEPSSQRMSSSDEEEMWCTKLFRTLEISGAVNTLLSLKIFLCVPQIENYDEPPASDVSLPLIKILAGLVVGPHDIRYFSRFDNSYKDRIVTPVVRSQKLGQFPPFASLGSQPLEWRTKLLVEALGAERCLETPDIPDDWKLILSTLIYWINNASPDNYNVLSCLMMLITLKVAQNDQYMPQLNRGLANNLVRSSSQASRNERLSTVLSRVSSTDCVRFKYIIDEIESGYDHFIYISTLHTLAQLQSSIEAANMLNSTLGCPFRPIFPSEFINSTLYHKLVTNTRSGTNLAEDFETYMMDTPSIQRVFRVLCTIISNATKLDLFSRRTGCYKRPFPSSRARFNGPSSFKGRFN